ncbi:MAG TPA: serine hydrolase [Planctomycetia bacterium]|nr:serine hydrolase [Planctomycetia bacterium]
MHRRFFVLISTAAALALAANSARAELNIDEVALKAMAKFEVPGMAVGVVKDGKLIFAKGYGVRKLGEAAPVTPQTLFGIASNTKAFTAAALAMLVDEGKIGWDDPVCTRLPSFQLYDPIVTREITLRDLLTHRCGLGLGAGDLMFFPPTKLSRSEILAKLRHVKPNTSFRSKYAYNNLMFLAAGEVIPAVTGKSWDDFIAERIFKPLGMTASCTNFKNYGPTTNAAYPHALDGSVLRSVPLSPLDNNAACGGINSNIEDAAKWTAAMLAGGKTPSGARLVSEKQAKEMWSAQTVVPIADPPAPVAATKANFAAYGLGWFLTDYRGVKLCYHTGGLAGMVTRITLVPDKNLALLVFTNQEVGHAFQAVTYSLLDEHLGTPTKTDWVEAFAAAKKIKDDEANAKVAKAAAGRSAASKPSLPLAKYALTLRDAWYGDVFVTEEKGKLRIKFSHSPELVGSLEHWQYDTFVARWDNRTLLADAYLTYSLNPDGSIERAKMEAVSPLTDFSYDFHDLTLTPTPPKPATKEASKKVAAKTAAAGPGKSPSGVTN